MVEAPGIEDVPHKPEYTVALLRLDNHARCEMDKKSAEEKPLCHKGIPIVLPRVQYPQ